MDKEDKSLMLERHGSIAAADTPLWWQGRWWRFDEVPDTYFAAHPLPQDGAASVSHPDPFVASMAAQHARRVQTG